MLSPHQRKGALSLLPTSFLCDEKIFPKKAEGTQRNGGKTMALICRQAQLNSQQLSAKLSQISLFNTT